MPDIIAGRDRSSLTDPRTREFETDPFGRGAPALDTLEDSTTTPGVVYYGTARPGTLTSAAGWTICRETLATGAVGWANGGAADQVWDNRATTVTYSR